MQANEEAEEPACVRGEKPSDAEIRAHNLKHLPFRSWCPHCVRGKAVAGIHRRKEQDRESAIPIVSIDYAFLKSKKTKSGDGGEQEDKERNEEESDDGTGSTESD